MCPSLELGPMNGSCFVDISIGKSRAGALKPGVLGGGVVSTAGELVLDGDDRVGFERDDWE